uniref:Uncharacterized protein n=1 Tax=Anguilla anguilla TaxID=7936 RepID=A0A0E9PQQ5_ANGAN
MGSQILMISQTYDLPHDALMWGHHLGNSCKNSITPCDRMTSWYS